MGFFDKMALKLEITQLEKKIEYIRKNAPQDQKYDLVRDLQEQIKYKREQLKEL
jgi:hypothetical protein